MKTFDMTKNLLTRRLALFRIGTSSAVASAAIAPTLLATKLGPQPESPDHFTHPAEYLAAMKAIGWSPVAMYQMTDEVAN